ncbi:MAG: ATP-binding protein [Candidatus Thorarchaeota archaeon]
MNDFLDGIESTAEISVSDDPFERIIGQDDAVTLVRSAISQRRHVLLCGVPGIGKSMLAKAAATLLLPPSEEISLRPNPTQVDRPIIVVRQAAEVKDRASPEVLDRSYIRPEDLPFEVASKMGYRCPRCGSFSAPLQSTCMDCGSAKRSDKIDNNSYHGLFRRLDVLVEPVLTTVVEYKQGADGRYSITYQRASDGMICVSLSRLEVDTDLPRYQDESDEQILVSKGESRFIRVSGSSPAEILGDVKHDPYGSAESLGVAPHRRVIPGAIHEAHEGILYIDEIAALGTYQKHLLTAMQDRRYPISGHNPHSSGAAVRVDDVPCDFVLIASCNIEDLTTILPPLRSRIRGYGYEIMLSSWVRKSSEIRKQLVRFIAQTIKDDGRIPHFSHDAILEVLDSAERMAFSLDHQKDAFTLRLRELGGLVRIAGDLAVAAGSDNVEMDHVKSAEPLSKGFTDLQMISGQNTEMPIERYGDYFF